MCDVSECRLTIVPFLQSAVSSKRLHSNVSLSAMNSGSGVLLLTSIDTLRCGYLSGPMYHILHLRDISDDDEGSISSYVPILNATEDVFISTEPRRLAGLCVCVLFH